jgi:hypothetical protein
MRHTHRVNPSPTSSSEIRPSKPQTSVGQVFALVAGFLALAAIGAVIGWNLTDTSGMPVSAPSTSVTVTSAPPSSPPPPSPTPSASVPVTGFTLPDYVAGQTDFQIARAQMMGAGLGVQITFHSKGVSDGSVVSMDPVAGTVVQKGTTVKITVDEPAPLLAVPNVVGLSCADAGHQLASTGFTPNYPNGKTGTVSAQDPPEDTDLSNLGHHWYDIVKITCGTPPPASPSPSPSDSPPTN